MWPTWARRVTAERAHATAAAGLGMAAALWLGGCAALRPALDYPARPPAELDPAGTVAVIGDLQMTSWIVRAATRAEQNHDAQARLLADLAARTDELAALALVGDLVYTAWSRRDWAHFDALMAPFATRVPLLPALGNHDYRCVFMHLCTQRIVPRNVLLRFPWLVPGGAYWVSYGDVALAFLDSETGLDAQAAWLERLLGEIATTHAAIVVFAHRPPYTDSTARGLEPELEIRARILPVLDRSPLVSVLVSGHAHGYEHQLVGGRHYIVSAGGGGPRSPLRAARPNDVYAGPDCDTAPSGAVRRPFNYLLLERSEHALAITVRGLCKDDAAPRVLEAFAIGI